ncbi:hypothetical protein B5P22_31195 [Pseudomonas tolaasii]|uniref:Phage structural protein n=1 Tax=Pseudomonas phage UFV-P2 TaxID=1235661 RepID=K0IK57_9CAUD|nr:virion structural protein [Pseudomonas phage UFV-P2]AFU62931.1 phage structural protein [Pseudomonas phage UFV-P2]ARB31574.1 hypothetical protein B5P22_31195 [Pseudomonas tolaasii]
MSAVAQKLFALGQSLNNGTDFQVQRPNSSYRPMQAPAMHQAPQQQGSGMGAVGNVAGRMIGEGIKSYMQPTAAQVPDTLSLEGAAPAIQQGADSIGAGLGAGQMSLPSAQSMGFGQSPQASQGLMGIMGSLFGG